MSTAELKLSLYNLIDNINDNAVLQRVHSLLSKSNTDWWDAISDEEKEAIHVGTQQLANGEGIPHEEVQKKVDKLLGRE